MTYKVIIDTDPGVDDALAIAYAILNPEIELVGLTTVFGNVSVEQSTLNAGYLLDLLDHKHIPVAKGVSTPLKQTPHPFPDFVHGENGFGNINIQYPDDFKPHSLSAADFIVEQINKFPGEIILAPIGPLTNIALALQKDPSIAQKVKRVVIMGGAAHVTGNVSPAAEANLWNDAHAGQIVFSAPWEIVMVGLDVTYKTLMTMKEMERVRTSSPKVGGFLYEICAHYADFYQNTAGFSGFSLHDPATIMYITHPELFKTQQGQIDVVVDAAGYGKTFFAPKGKTYAESCWSKRDNVHLCVDVDSEGISKLLESYLSKGK